MSRLARLKRACAFVGGALADHVFEQAHELRRGPRGLLHADCAPRRATLTRAIHAGTDFLRRAADEDGLLRGFCLPPGASDTWLTAHVCFVTAAVPALDDLAAAAARSLAAFGPEEGGWGYNRRVGVDLDSTVQALMLLERMAQPCPAFLGEQVLAAQCDAGGFPTYAPPHGVRAAEHGWQVAHADVSAMVYAWLGAVATRATPAARCRAWLAGQCARGELPCYWWDDGSYGQWLLARAGLAGLCDVTAITRYLDSAGGAPQLAQAIVAALARGVCLERLPRSATRLLSAQHADGGWPCQPCLRVTDRRCHTSGGAASGRVYADRRRVFSTAHAVAALTALAGAGMAD